MIAPAAEATGLAASIAAFAAPWAKIFSHSKVVSAGTLFFHLVPLIAGGGVAFAADIATLRAFRSDAAERTRQVAALASTHRLVVFGLTLSFISGVMLFLSDVGDVPWLGLHLDQARLRGGPADQRLRPHARGGGAGAGRERRRAMEPSSDGRDAQRLPLDRNDTRGRRAEGIRVRGVTIS